MQDVEENGNILISIIIPTYNRAGFLERCVDSLLVQIQDDVQIIIVDDGSNDDTHEILSRYKNNEHITVAYRQHGGVSKARNHGLAIAAGKYVSFVDSDDYVGDGYISTLLDAAEAGSDMAVFDSRYKSDVKGIMQEDVVGIDVRGELPAQRMYPILLGQGLNSVSGKLFRNRILRKYEVRFDESMVISEDFMFVMDSLEHCETVNIYGKIPYYYDYNPNGTGKVKTQHLVDLIKSYNRMCRFIEEKHVILEEPIWNMQLVHSRILWHACSIVVGLCNSGNFLMEQSESLINSRLYQDVTAERYDKLKYEVMKKLMRGQHWRILCLLFKMKGIG